MRVDRPTGQVRRAVLGAALMGLLLAPPLLAWAVEVSASSREGFDPASVKRVAFLPLARMAGDAEFGRAVCPVGGEPFYSGKIEDAAEAELSRALGRSFLDSGLEVDWVGQTEINAARDRLKKEGHPEYNQYGSWQLAIGRELKTPVLFGFIYVYRDRVGAPWSASTPAAVSFCLHLVDPDSGQALWDYRYADEQRPLSENLLELPAFLKRRGRWIAVEQMADEAAAATVKKLPWAKSGA